MKSALRVGIGYDSHQLAEGRPLMLGGVQVPFDKGLRGHSDGDVLLHAICDALLGAGGLPDIGQLFPDNDPQWKDADSHFLLARVGARLHSDNWQVVNIDAVLIAERPKISSFVPNMCMRIASALQVAPNCVNIRGKTAEGLGALGAGEGMAAHAVCLIIRKD